MHSFSKLFQYSFDKSGGGIRCFLFRSFVMRCNYIFLLTSLISISAFSQSGWTREKGGIFLHGSYSSFRSDQYYNTDGELQKSAKGTDYIASAYKLYAEYGVHDRFTAMLNFPMLKGNALSTTETVYGTGDLRLGFKYKLLKNTPLSFAMEAELPTNKGENIAFNKESNAFGFKESINLPTSDGEFNVWSTLAFSSSTSNGQFYASAFTSVNYRTEDLSHQLKAGTEAGALFGSKFWLIAKLNIQKSLSAEAKRVPFLYGEGSEYTAYSFTGIYKFFKQWSLSGEYAHCNSLIISPKNVYAGPTFSLGLVWEY
jgi:hypothetical protein